MTLFKKVLYIRFLFLSALWVTVGGAYFPNFGFVGCYLYDGQMEKFSNYNPTNVTVPLTSKSQIILCFKECLNTRRKYAGLKPKDKNNYRCFCGDHYNQTFAVDEALCSNETQKRMKIYNTDYDIKPLLSVPGSQSNIVEIWNATKRYTTMFVNNVMRNPAIDWWKDNLLYHTPEYVKVSALNKYGQELWANEFFTNKSSADITEWLIPQNSLNLSISRSEIIVNNQQIVIMKKSEAEKKYYFLHGSIEKNGPRLTVVTKDGNPKSGKRYGIRTDALNKKRLASLKTNEYICGVEVQENISITANQQTDERCYKEDSINSTYFLESCVLASSVELEKCTNESTDEFVCTYDQMMSCALSEHADQKFCDGVSVTRMRGLKKIGLTIKNASGINDAIPDVAEFYNSSKTLNGICSCTTLTITSRCTDNKFSVYTVKDDALLLADRVVFLGYYHKEEPKVSKWEFLNSFSIEEIQNIMRPVLQKVHHQGSVPVRNLSSSIRKKESATDMRTSSKGIGLLGGGLLGLVFLIIIVSDIVIIKTQIRALFRNISGLCRTKKPSRINDCGEK